MCGEGQYRNAKSAVSCQTVCLVFKKNPFIVIATIICFHKKEMENCHVLASNNCMIDYKTWKPDILSGSTSQNVKRKLKFVVCRLQKFDNVSVSTKYLKKVSEYDQGKPQLLTTPQPMAP